MAKRNYSGKLSNKLSSSDTASVWKGMKDITSYKTPSLSTLDNQQLADDLNDFTVGLKKTYRPGLQKIIFMFNLSNIVLVILYNDLLLVFVEKDRT